ncbi:MAG TPA: LysR family transcriptional regulator [Burkholderiales bacterium]|jgi:DNA-binding transcriptional LysR family regulator
MELRDIEYFAAVAKHGNLGRAAEALGMSQSALSKSLRRLEGEIRAKLVKRTPKGVELTAEGSTLLSRMRQVQLTLVDVTREVSEVSQGLAGHLRISAGPGHSYYLLPTACSAFLAQAPNATLNVRDLGQGVAIQALRNGDVDVAITAIRPSLEHDIVQEHLYDDEYVVCASVNHRLAKKRQVTLADVARERWAQSEPTSALWQHMHQVFERNGLPPPRVTVQAPSPTLRLSLVASSDLLGFTMISLVRQVSPYLRLSVLHVKELTLPLRLVVSYRKSGYLSPVAKRFIEILKMTAKEIIEAK